MKHKLLKLARRAIRPLTGQLRKIRARYIKLVEKRVYNTQAVHNEMACFVEAEIQESAKVSVVVPVFNTEKDHLLDMIFSVINQHYQNWELILVNASTDASARRFVKNCSQIDTRIKIIRVENKGIAQNTNAGINEAEGEFVAFLDHDDVLHPCALHTLIELQQLTNADVLYSDEDKITHDGSFYLDPHCKPDWSSHLFENVNYINHLTIVRTALVKAVEGLRPECDGAQDYDFLLRITDLEGTVVAHAARTLYHWRAANTSTAKDISTKTYIFKAGKKALDDHFGRRKIQAHAKIIEGKPGFYKTLYEPVENVSIIIGTVDHEIQPACANWIAALAKPYGNNVEVIAGAWLKPFLPKLGLKNIKIVTPSPKNYLMQAAKKASNDIVIVFNNGAMPRQKEYLFELAAVAKYAGAELVQPIIVGQDDTIVDSGLTKSSYGLQPLFKGKKLGENTYFGNTDWTRDIEAISFSVFATKKETLQEMDNSAKTALVWTHTPFEWQSVLSQNKNLGYFNPQLGQSMFELLMQSSTWDETQERVHE